MAKVFLSTYASDVAASPTNDGRLPIWPLESGDAIASRTAKIQAYLNAGTCPILDDGVYVCNKLVLPTRMLIFGKSSTRTVLFQNDGLDSDFIVSDNIDAVWGTDLRYEENGVPYGCGLQNILVDGNRYNQNPNPSPGTYGRDLVRFWVYSPNMRNVRLCYSVGAGYRQGVGNEGTVPGPENDPGAGPGGWSKRSTQINGGIFDATLQWCDEGIVAEKGFDLIARGIQISSCDGPAFWVKSGAGAFRWDIHTWSCGRDGVRDGGILDGGGHFTFFEPDSHFGPGLRVNPGASFNCDHLHLIGCNKYFGTRSIILNSSNIDVAMVTGNVLPNKSSTNVSNDVPKIGIWATEGATRANIQNVNLFGKPGVDASDLKQRLVQVEGYGSRVSGIGHSCEVPFEVGRKSFTGVHSGSDGSLDLVCSEMSFLDSDAQMVGKTLTNITKGESTLVTGNTPTTVQGVLSGGALWDANDQFELAYTRITSGVKADVTVESCELGLRARWYRGNQANVLYDKESVDVPAELTISNYLATGISNGNTGGTVMQDTNLDLVNDELRGRYIINSSDGDSVAQIIKNTNTTIHGQLVGGTANTWVIGNEYEIVRNLINMQDF